MPKHSRIIPILVLVLVLAAASPAPAAEYTRTLLTKSKYFTIFGPSDLDVLTVLNKLNYDYFLQVDNLLDKKSGDPRGILGQTVDAMLMEASKVLGINVYSFQATLDFLPDRETVKITLKKVIGIDTDERGFYFDDEKTIYIAVDELAAGVLGHEMAHALVCHYFGAPPAANIQEILAGYVDFSFSKNIRTAVHP